MPTGQPIDEELDALVAAPLSHRVILENDQIRVLEVFLDPGQSEPVHIHAFPSVMYYLKPADVVYNLFNWDRRGWVMTLSTKIVNPEIGRVRWIEPESPHAVTNCGSERFFAIRVELKRGTQSDVASCGFAGGIT